MPRSRNPRAAPQPPNRTDALIARIEAIIEQGVADPLLQDPPQPLSLPLCTRKRTLADGRVAANVTFPGRTEAEARKFNQVLHLLKSAHTALRTGKVFTKRNLYYEESELYGSQARVDQLVDDLAATLGVGRHDLGIGSIIPPSNEIQKLDLGPTRWVLVIEKEATFRTLSKTRYWETSVAGPGLLVTGKGYPDLVTRSFLHKVHIARPTIPIYALVDYDPDGINIFRCYKWGSVALEHEEALKLPSLQWLGIKNRDLGSTADQGETSPFFDITPATRDIPSSQKLSYSQTKSYSRLVPLTQWDRKLAVKLLRDFSMVEGRDRDADAVEATRELQTMLMMNVKAEIQAMNHEGDIARYLERMLEGEYLRACLGQLGL
ncbi:uncharacterized protein DNG_08795 [Cephalotrichum gorgonifer]|uniref:DNA topoisomerase (ATP-hydrolyzing) n=1 Tax=Cephalotrichum gorgonifer TaxID=2041049 RepID=A0AAE8SYP3_9PEZI|nr:uncharacterized protein DNG_08795 [Cephalotrichum gorgonifer]